MADVPMPEAMSEESVAEWLFHLDYPRQAWEEADAGHLDTYLTCARAVLALVREKVREGVVLTQPDPGHVESVRATASIVARVMGMEAPRV